MENKKSKVKAKIVSVKTKGDNGQAKRNERYQKNWLKIFMLLLEYKAKHGHVNVPAREKFKGVSLGTWVVRQRVIKNKLPKEHRSLLNKARLNWDPNEEDWNLKFKLLLKFYEKNRHTFVPLDFQKYPELARWVHQQRKNRVVGILPEDKIRKLNHVHFVWDVREHLWELKFNQCHDFYVENGHFNIPSNASNKSLASWKNEQIRFYKNGKLSKEHFEQLKEIGFDLTNKKFTEVKLAHDINGKFIRIIPD